MNMDIDNISMQPVSPRPDKRKLIEDDIEDTKRFKSTDSVLDMGTPVAMQYETAQDNAEAEAETETEAELNTWNDVGTDKYADDYVLDKPTYDDKPATPETIQTALLSDLVCGVFSNACTQSVIIKATDSNIFKENMVDQIMMPSKHFATVFSNPPVDMPIYKAITILTNAINKETAKSHVKQTERASYITYLKKFLADLLKEQYRFITENTKEVLLKNPMFNEYVGVMTRPNLKVVDGKFVVTKNPIEPSDITTILYTYMRMCLNKPKLLQDPARVLNKLDEGRKFFPKFIDFLNPNQSTYQDIEPETQPLLAPDFDKNLDMSPGQTFLGSGLELNYQMENNFNGKIQSTNLDVFQQIQPKLVQLLDKISTPPLGVQITKFMTEPSTNQSKFKYAKFILDAGDILHDAEKVLADPSGKTPSDTGYYAGLIDIGNTTFQNERFDSTLLRKCLTNSSTLINNLATYWYSVQQDKLRNIRTDAINTLRNYISSSSSILLPTIVTTTLTRETGYFELIKQIFTIWGSSPDGNTLGDPFVYKESGRDLQINNICEYYKLLPADEQTKFIQDCVAYCDFPDSTNITLFTRSLLVSTNVCAHSLLVPLSITTSFDGCGTSHINPGDNCAKAVFNNVYGLYTYTIYTTLSDERVGKFCHLVTVTLTPNAGQTKQTVIAVFGLYGNITINMLLAQNKMPKTRTGEGAKGGFDNIKHILDLLKTRCTNSQLDEWLVSLDLTNIPGEGKVFYPTPQISKTQQDLLVLGNKTIGDLIVTAYPTTPLVCAIVTVDSLIANSTMYNFLCGNSSILQSVWMQSGGKGWRFTPGLANEDPKLKPASISIQMLSTYMLLRDIITLNQIVSLKDMRTVVNRLTPAFVTIINTITQSNLDDLTRLKKLTPLIRLTNFITYTFDDFKTITNYKEKGTIYDACFTQMLIYENFIMQCRVWYYLNLLDTIVTKYYQDTQPNALLLPAPDGVTTLEKCQIDFLNSINTLPKLQTLLISNVSNAFSNNSASVSIQELILNFPPLNPTDKFISIEHINSTKIKIKYDYKPGPTTADSFKKETNEVTIDAKGTKTDTGKVWTITFEFPYVIEILIQLLDTGKIKEPALGDGSSPMSTDAPTPSADNGIITDIQQRIKSFFETNVSTLDMEYNTIKLNTVSANKVSVNNKLVTTVLENITNILVTPPGIKPDGQTPGGILPLGTVLALGGTDDYDESPCGEGDCANGECENKMELGGTNKKTRKKRKTKQKRKTKGGKKPGKNKTKKQRKNKKNNKTRRRK